MTNNVEKINSGNAEIVNNSDSVNWQKFQEFWKSVTVRPETITKSFNKPYQYEFSDIEDIHHRIIEVSKTYEVKSLACSFTAYYRDQKSKRTFNSFETFEAGVRGGTSPTKTITLEYNFIIQHPQTKNCGSYKITIDLVSKLAGDDFAVFPKFMRGFSNITGYIKVEHVDYVVAQNFVNVVKDWFDTRRTARENKFIKFLQNYSEYIPALCVSLVTIIFTYTVYQSVDQNLANNDLITFAKFLIANLTIVVITREILYKVGLIIEDNIDSFCALTYIDLTKGDKNLISEFKEKQEKGFRKTVYFLVVQIFVGVVSSIISTILFGIN